MISQTALSASRKISAPTAALHLLSEGEDIEYRAYLKRKNMEGPANSGASALSGSIGIRADILSQAVHIADIFRRAALILHRQILTDPALQKTLLRPFVSLPILREAALSSPFFLKYFRMDFFLDPKEGRLQIMEVNSGGASLTDMWTCIDFLKKFHAFTPPPGCRHLRVTDMLQCLTQFCKERGRAKTLGLVAEENGDSDFLEECLRYANWLTLHSETRPVLLKLRDGELTLLENENVPSPIQNLSELDAVFADWFETPLLLEHVQKQMNDCSILAVPTRADLLFENKHFLSVLQEIERPKGISEEEWNLLQSSLLRSFPLEDFPRHLKEIKEWKGVVLKMDIDCASENVFLYDYRQQPYESVLAALKDKRRESLNSGVTWTIQELVHPPTLPLNGSTPSWTTSDYAPYKYDLMTYLCYPESEPHVLFGSRCFRGDKWDELTEQGKADGLYCPVSTI